MSLKKFHLDTPSRAAVPTRIWERTLRSALGLALALAFCGAASAQEPTPQPPATPQSAPAQQPDGTAAPAPAAATDSKPAEQAPASAPAQAPAAAAPQSTPEAAPEASAPEPFQEGGITEAELKQMLVGKPLYLRGGYLENSLNFNEHGKLIGHSREGSYTLSAIQIDKVRLTKHKVELEGARYGLHFLGALPYEDPTKALDRVRITPAKKVVKLTIDRELVVKPKKKKESGKNKKGTPGVPPQTAAAPQANAAAAASAAPSTDALPDAPAAATASVPPASTAAKAQPTAPAAPEPGDADEAKAEMAAAPPEERPADPNSVTTTLFPAHAKKVLTDALDQIFAPGLDDRMMAAMPDFWKLYYQAVAAKADYRSKDPSVLRQNTVDKKAVLVSKFEPESNEWAQANGVAGMSQYHAVIGPDGKVGEVAVSRPIGFGLDENAVEAIRKATFEPAMKDGKPVAVMINLNVSFRIYSHRTEGKQEADDKAPNKPAQPTLPGPYSVQH
jgi:TonB family protein